MIVSAVSCLLDIGSVVARVELATVLDEAVERVEDRLDGVLNVGEVDRVAARVGRHVEEGWEAHVLVRLLQAHAVLLEALQVDGEDGGQVADEVLLEGLAEHFVLRFGRAVCVAVGSGSALVAGELIGEYLFGGELGELWGC